MSERQKTGLQFLAVFGTIPQLVLDVSAVPWRRFRGNVRPVTGQLISRGVAERVLEALADTPVVVVNGPRQAGKTTLVQHLPYTGSHEMVTLDDTISRQSAGLDPRSFVDRDVDTLVIDEAQLEPDLFRGIKAAVDRDRRAGRFLLTGSSRLLSAPGMADALVGRVETIELWPLAERELAAELRPTFVDMVFDRPARLRRRGRERPLRSCHASPAGRIFRGIAPKPHPSAGVVRELRPDNGRRRRRPRCSTRAAGGDASPTPPVPRREPAPNST